MALDDEDRLTLMFEDTPTTTRLSGPREPPSEQSFGPPSSRLDKGKAKMSEYDDLNDNASTHSLDSESEGLNIPIICWPVRSGRTSGEAESDIVI